MTDWKIEKNLEKIANAFDGILLDAYGVFWGGNAVGLFPGCRELMKKLVDAGKYIGILSNSTQLAEIEIEKVKKHGLIRGEHFHFYLTSGSVAKRLFEQEQLSFPTPQKKYVLFGTPHPKFNTHKALFESTPFEETHDLDKADFIYISVPHVLGNDERDPKVFVNQVEAYRHVQIPMVCINPDLFAHEGIPPKLVVRQGSIAALHEQQGGNVVYFGKPSQIMFDSAMKAFAPFGLRNPKSIVMVGDTPETDIRGARSFGMHSALILKTGVTAEKIESMGVNNALGFLKNEERPDFFIESLA